MANMREIVERAAELHEEVMRKRRERDGDRTSFRPGHGDSDEAFKRLLNDPPDMEPVWDYLRTLHEDDVYALKRLMYKGRDGGDPTPMRDDKERMILDITEKKQFGAYIRAGLSGRQWRPGT